MATFGSLGDLHPYIALALGLKQRGHDPVIATSPAYGEKIKALGIGFAPVRPDHPDFEADPDLVRRLMDLRTGSEYVVRQMVMPVIAESFADTEAAARGADLLVSHPLTFAVPLLAELRGLPWASTMLAPLGFFSAYDPPVIPPAQWLSRLRFLGPVFWRTLFGAARRMCRSWCAPYVQFRRELGLPSTGREPLFEGQHSPHLVLAMFSSLLAAPQPDWPAATQVTGYAFYDRHEENTALSPELQAFLEAGEPPIVFTLGSSAVLDAGTFYAVSAEAAKRLGRRAILLVGKDERNRLSSLPEGVIAAEYAPYSELFPRAAAIVHQGGAGTTGQALRAGKPMLFMPYAHDQPDNAKRVADFGAARVISRDRYTPDRAAAELRQLLGERRYADRATEAGKHVRGEDGVKAACMALERLITSTTVEGRIG